MGVTSGAGTAYPSGSPEFTPGFSGVRVTLSLVLYICLVDRCLTLCTFSFGHCVVLRYTNSDCPFSVFLWVNCKKSKPVQLENYTQYNLYRSKIEKKIGSMNGLCHFFYILELKLGNIYFTTVQSYNKIISVLKKITWFSAKHAPLNFFTV